MAQRVGKGESLGGLARSEDLGSLNRKYFKRSKEEVKVGHFALFILGVAGMIGSLILIIWGGDFFNLVFGAIGLLGCFGLALLAMMEMQGRIS